jgi:hypothetical protein
MPAMPKFTRRFDVFGPLPYDPDVTRSYEMVPGTDPLDALFVVQRDGLGVGRVRLIDGALWFADPGDRELCAGTWQVTQQGCNGSTASTRITIPAVDPADGSREAA